MSRPGAAGHRSLALWLALAWALLVVYASLFPFTGWRWPPGQAAQALLVLPWPPWRDEFDLWANFAGYLPLGALLLIALRRAGRAPGLALALALALPSLLSYATEVTQQLLPGRHPSLKDWLANTLGAASGVLMGGALHGLGLIDRWSAWRARWFARASAGALALLALWPAALLFPAPVPLGLGQIGVRLREWALEGLEGVPWAEPAHALLVGWPAQEAPLWPPAEAAVTALGLLAPVLVAYTIVPRGWRRLVVAAGAAALAVGVMTLSTLLNFGPEHALSWVTPASGPALAAGVVLAVAALPVGPRLAAGLGLVVLTGLVVLVAQAPADPYFAQSLARWEQGRWVRFHGLAQWVGWLWPYLAMLWLLGRLAARAPR